MFVRALLTIFQGKFIFYFCVCFLLLCRKLYSETLYFYFSKDLKTQDFFLNIKRLYFAIYELSKLPIRFMSNLGIRHQELKKNLNINWESNGCF